MFYKYEEETDNWLIGNKISFPDGVTISIDNKIEKDGWFWSEEPPTEYTEWLQLQEEN
tara:strand:- start:181 stop:354 length:174 start_codon:yes stop_codon:yes gene_type:complete